MTVVLFVSTSIIDPAIYHVLGLHVNTVQMTEVKLG